METTATILEPIEAGEMPAGGTDSTRFDWTEVWYPVYYIQDLDKSKLAPFTLLGRDLVIWWDRIASCWRVFEDRCPHRLAPLSEGRIAEDGLLECPYHGWAFAGEGSCDRIPQQLEGGSAQTSQRAGVASLPTTERQGLLFVYAGQPENAPKVKVPILELLEEFTDEWICLNTFRDLPYDALTLLENVLDASHVPFTHHRSVGNRAYASPVELEITESSRQGFKGMWEQGPRKGTLGRQDTTFIAPGLMWHDLTSKQFGRTLTVVYATPIRKGECRLFARFPFKFSSKLPGLFIKLTPRWYSHIGQNGVLEDDQIFLHYQERSLEEKGGSSNFAKAFYLPTKADHFVFELRQWVNQYNANPFVDQTLPSRLPKETLLDRYHSHTIKCKSCSTALVRIRQIRLGVALVGVLAWAIVPLLALLFGKTATAVAVVSTALALLLGAAWFGLGRLEQRFYQGREIPPRNNS
ncbi:MULTISPECIES: Rieske 2Fe-2S domain-containing protein [unclassified Coleofasciculus]|uniref:aromatic ring-hydroxylating dioxygenase subunit alpha n=1 Tax=unclassified Coleofasciculus TaxID=2692782 RepID=UPI00187F1D38|nr:MULTISPECIES: Rieske 2Fe-2S domain-containing protein [unclassified Coleofasciculus]MBE9128268.1 Rieske 2Fe-2S domain-containing protein [Coleofasciculus sp. LEGE 07081]MBE9151315.1 Rieske 2Fe-2S domain-containing protein [Coleofasciculus sp. LEGE 07092]